MVKYLGDYSHTGHREAELPLNITTTHNILLEYGEMDLQEYFLAFSPPILNAEVKTFWNNMLEVAQALEGIHNLKTKKYETVQEYHGSVYTLFLGVVQYANWTGGTPTSNQIIFFGSLLHLIPWVFWLYLTWACHHSTVI